MANLRFLIDTNVAIPLEPTSTTDVGVMTPEAIELQGACQRAGVGLFLHPASRQDLARDMNADRRRLREVLFGKYAMLEDPPEISQGTKDIIGDPPIGSNDWVDHCLLEAVRRSCAHFLVSEDREIHRKAKRLGVSNVVLIREAIRIVKRLFDDEVEPPPAVEDLFVYNLDESDAIFDSFREDYPGFDAWLKKCREAHRRAWVIKRDAAIAAFSIYKPEDGAEVGLAGRALKLCSFKVAEEYRGLAFGELLLRSAYAYADANDFEWIYLTAFEERQPFLIDFLEDNGFERLGAQTGLGEAILAKPVGIRQGLPTWSDPAKMLRRYGPFSFMRDSVGAFVVPIQPQYHALLFPDAEAQPDLFPGQRYFGNALRKAYLCNASVRTLQAGDLLFFYQSQGFSTIQVAGVVEAVVVSRDAAEVAAFVGKRTVYSFSEIEAMVRDREVLAILFMAVKVKGAEVGLPALVGHQVVSAPPQSIQNIPSESRSWLLNQLQL